MSLKERVYSVLVVSAAKDRGAALTSLMSPARYNPIETVSDIGAARRAASERDFDFVIISAPLPDGSAAGLAMDAAETKRTVPLLMVPAEIHEEVFDKVAASGVFTLPRPTSKTLFLTALNWMSALRERML
ncbi:MAG: antitermination regulator, partial [Abditibacteriota bacterium]|nr:antitermination regulator [Abditibacteriota bacterium]